MLALWLKCQEAQLLDRTSNLLINRRLNGFGFAPASLLEPVQPYDHRADCVGNVEFGAKGNRASFIGASPKFQLGKNTVRRLLC